MKSWKNVTFPTKKDGKPYKAMSRNFKGAKYASTDYATQNGEMELIVYTQADVIIDNYSHKGSRYVHDSIKCYDLVCYMTDEHKLSKTENYQPKICTWLNQVYTYDLEDIKQAIEQRIEQLEKSIDAMEKELSVCDIAFEEYTNAIEKAQKQLAERTIINDNKALYYMMYEV